MKSQLLFLHTYHIPLYAVHDNKWSTKSEERTTKDHISHSHRGTNGAVECLIAYRKFGNGGYKGYIFRLTTKCTCFFCHYLHYTRFSVHSTKFWYFINTILSAAVVGGSHTWLKCTRGGDFTGAGVLFGPIGSWVRTKVAIWAKTAHMIYIKPLWVLSDGRMAGKSSNSGTEHVLTHKISPWWATYGALMWVFGENDCVMMRVICSNNCSVTCVSVACYWRSQIWSPWQALLIFQIMKWEHMKGMERDCNHVTFNW